MLLKGSRGAAGRGPVWWRAGLGSEGRASQQIPPWRLDEGGAQAAASGEADQRTRAKLPRGRQPPLESAQLPTRTRSRLVKWPQGRRGEGRKSDHVTRKRLRLWPARLRTYGGAAGTPARGCLGFFSGWMIGFCGALN